ncbi:Very short patch repair protein [anaerobic digester metagenome]
MSKTTEQISYNMKRIKSKDTEIEIILRRELWRRGLRYRKNDKNVIGKPDVSFKKKKVAVFCDSEFWHGYDWEHKQAELKTRRDFWIKKIERNIERDKEVNESLEAEGWLVLRFWGTDIRKNVEACADLIVEALKEKDKC